MAAIFGLKAMALVTRVTKGVVIRILRPYNYGEELVAETRGIVHHRVQARERERQIRYITCTRIVPGPTAGMCFEQTCGQKKHTFYGGNMNMTMESGTLLGICFYCYHKCYILRILTAHLRI